MTRPDPSPWGERLPFGTLCGEYQSEYSGWIHDLSFSPDGNTLAFVCMICFFAFLPLYSIIDIYLKCTLAHDSILSICNPEDHSVSSIKTTQLPYKCVLWMPDGRLVVSGYNDLPGIYSLSQDSWQYKALVDRAGSSKRKTSLAASADSKSNVFNMFRNMDSRMTAMRNLEEEEEQPQEDLHGTIA
ncbi:hypothetical protein BB560_007111 [Smittium megazygosporum]|uniref:Uncharacterized protein n=1 Tax=Smittium megazygosporum TaxID=133381 RepID=A0A2T9XYX2_9FUNG|nr:hypothetical protein BB560_007111 [Smittium megazygosporum]